MKKMLRVPALSLALLLLPALISCSPASSKSYRVGIVQLAAHDALDAATQGFQDALNDRLPGQVEYDLQNAANDPAVCATIANDFVSSKVDLILANATPALQAAASATDGIPVLGTSVSEYGVALGVEDFAGTVGANVSGTSDLAPLDRQAKMILDWLPDVREVGILYCSREANSLYQVETVQKYLEELGCVCTQYAFTDSNDLAAVCQYAAAHSEVLYIPTDNTCASNALLIDNLCRSAGVPVFTGDEGTCKGCGVATLTIDYYDIGYVTGEMAAKILTGEAQAGEMPIQYAPRVTPKYNKAVCEDLGLTPPADGYVPIAGT